MPSRRFKFLLLVPAFALLALAALPWWLGAVLRPVLQANGVTFARYERTGYARFLLHEVQFQAPSVAITADRVQAPTPVLWLGQRLRGSAPLLTVEGWQVARRAGAPASDVPPAVASVPDLQVLLQRVIPRVGYWVPQLQLSAGRVRGFGPEIVIAQARWHQATLQVDGLRVAEQELAVTLVPSADGTVTLTARTANGDARLQLRWSGAEVTGEATWWEQPLQLTARFPAQGWMPAEATVVAENWRLPATRVKLGAPYAWVQGGARFAWRDSAFELSLDAKAEPAPDTKAPPFAARAAARGGLRELTLTTLHVDAPFATARLSAPVVFSLDRPLASESAQLTVEADLAKLPWLPAARGQVAGSVTVRGDTAAARQEFELTFTDVAVQDLAVRSAEARGTLAWPLLELSQFDVQLDATSALSAHGAINWQSRELIGAAGQAKLEPAWFARWLPAGSTWTTAELSATASGPLDAPQHEGSLKLTGVEHPPLLPLAFEATWRGTGSKADVTARAVANDSSLELAGTLGPQGLLLAQLTFAPGGQAAWQLVAPAQLAWSPVWQIDDLQLGNLESHLRLEARGGPEGFFTLAAAGFDSTWLADWITPAGPAWQVQSLQAGGRVADRVLVFDATLAGRIAMDPQPARFRLAVSGDADGVQLQDLSVTGSDRVLTRAAGRLPLRWVVAPVPRLELDETAPLELTASTDPDSPLWATLADFAGLELTHPTARINLTGTPREPVGDLQVAIGRLGAAPGRFGFPLPTLDDLSLTVRFARAAVTITGFSAKLDGQAVQASGSLPMDDGRWMRLWREPAAFDWSRTTAHVEIPDADLAPLARRFPRFLAAQGRLHARVEHTPGAGFAGELRLSDAASRPLPPFGTLQEIAASLTLKDRTLTIQSLAAQLGGEPVTMAGTVTLVPAAPPRLALTLKGDNLPLVRTSGLLLRSDLDLRADTDDAGLTRIAGTVNVRDGLVLANVNLRTLLPTGPRGVTRHPPYFAVDAEPYRHWPLAVEIRAPGTVRVRTTVYHGTTSARFRLGGTLGEPRAVGELSVDQGRILFPFATFRVQQGAVRLSEADPFRAQVGLNATSQRRDYQLRLEMTGELPTPNITLSSAPALEAEEVLLMVMTGQLPASDASATSSGTQRLAVLGAYLGRDLFRGLGFGDGGNRLEITSGTHVSRQGRETYSIEYRLDDRWTLQGEYDQFDSYNAGLKWRVYTGEGKSDEKE